MFSNKLLFSSYEEQLNKKFKASIHNFNEVYMTLINEWASNLYTPANILDLFTRKVIEGISSNINEFSLGMDFETLNSMLVKNDYKYYKNFCNAFIQFKNMFKNDINYLKKFYIYVSVCNLKDINSIKSALIQTSYYQYSQQIYLQAQNTDFPSSLIFKFGYKPGTDISFYTLCKGCLIIINSSDSSKNKLTDANYIEKLLDHEFNHYFSLVMEKLKSYKEINPSQIFKKIINNTGYCYNDDLLTHLFSDRQYTSMCADVCNSIDFYLKELYPDLSNSDLYYRWIDMSSQKFLVSFKFQQLDDELQKSLLFSFACRYFDKERWNDLKEHVKVQLNNPSVNFLKASINWLKELFHKV